ncbi:hypothetical protein CDL15_Pgr001249 [Punica granatum]|uniref:DUF309 domain-containing protein n=1 Tax=Punica granatum TaxID=22663 RepID=A0A218WK10_PUNGR|nr:hypothetical protein CDL15_Pgr001249 [Punica granatum]
MAALLKLTRLSSFNPHGTSSPTSMISHTLLSTQLHFHHPSSFPSSPPNSFASRTSTSANPALSLRCPNQGPFRVSYRFSYEKDGGGDDNDGDGWPGDESFNGAVALFNEMEYYKCHDFLEALWNGAEEPRRTLFHGILQCAVGFHHLFNQNHKGAMMELGEGLCKLRKMNFESGPFYQFEQEISAALDFIYQTQIELAACAEDLCLAMDRSERSYQLLGGYAAGQSLYQLEQDPREDIAYIVFSPERTISNGELLRVKLPTLSASEEHLCSI